MLWLCVSTAHSIISVVVVDGLLLAVFKRLTSPRSLVLAALTVLCFLTLSLSLDPTADRVHAEHLKTTWHASVPFYGDLNGSLRRNIHACFFFGSELSCLPLLLVETATEGQKTGNHETVLTAASAPGVLTWGIRTAA